MSGMGGMSGMAPGAIVPELILLAGAVLGLVTGLFLPRERQWLVTLGAGVTLVLAMAATLRDLARPAQVVFEGTYAVDVPTGLTRLVVLGATLLVVAMSVEQVRGHERETEFSFLLQLASLGAILLAGASDVMFVVVAYLLLSVPLYTLTGFAKDAAGTEAAMKYFLMGALLGAVMLYGFAYLYGAGGATDYAGLAAGVGDAGRTALVIGVVGALAGLAFKLGAVPAHFWVPDVTEGAPPTVAAYVTTIPKVAALVATARLLVVVVPEHLLDWRLLVAVIATACMTLGNLAAFWQDSPRRLLGYSTISQVGYLLLGVVAAGRVEGGVAALLYYSAAYAVMNLGAFAVVAELPAARRLGDYAGLARRQPDLAVALTVCLLSLIGIPPLAGFVGKLTVFAAAWEAGFGWLTVIAAANTVLSVFYYFRWIAPLYTGLGALGERLDGDATVAQPLGTWTRAVATGAALGTLALGVAGRAVLDVAAGARLLGG